MVEGASAEPRVEDLGTNGLQVMYDKGPEMEDILAGHVVPHFHYNGLSSQEADLYGSPQPAGTSSYYKHLGNILYIDVPV